MQLRGQQENVIVAVVDKESSSTFGLAPSWKGKKRFRLTNQQLGQEKNTNVCFYRPLFLLLSSFPLLFLTANVFGELFFQSLGTLG